MLLIVAAAILGAAVGLYIRPRVFALAIALSVSGAAQMVLVFVGRLTEGRPDHDRIVRALEFFSVLDVHGVWPVMAAAGTGTLLAALGWSVVRQDTTDAFWFPGLETDRRRGVRSMELVEDRAIHAEARERLDSILRR